MTLDDAIVAAVRAAVRAELEQFEPEPTESKPVLVDRQGLAAALSVSCGSVDKLRREGMPEIRVGDCPRFCVADCVEWLKSRPK